MAHTPAGPLDEDHRRTEARLALALDAAGLGSWEFNLRTRALSASDRCKANHGLPPEAIITLDTDIVGSIDVTHQQVFLEALERTIGDGGDLQIEVPNTWPDGSRHWLMIRGRKVDEDLLLGVTLDVTERRRLEDTLREADRRKDEFLALLGHELRNPLAPIIAAARYLEMRGPSDPKLQHARATILRQAAHMSKIVDDLMDVGRINAGKLELQKTRADLKAIVLQAVETCTPALEQRKHTLTLSLPEEPVYLDVDPRRMVQVLCNLLNNSAKYMDEGGRVFLTGRSENETVVISVRDEGVGIAPDMLDMIFQRFAQIGTSRYRAAGGLGLGLALVKSIVELHDGSVQAHSEGLGQGSEFRILLPASA